MGTTNQDNNLKCDVYGSKEWRPVQYFAGKDENGKAKARPGFKNLLTDQEVHGAEPPYKAGEAHGFRVTDAFRQNYDQIQWEK